MQNLLNEKRLEQKWEDVAGRDGDELSEKSELKKHRERKKCRGQIYSYSACGCYSRHAEELEICVRVESDKKVGW